MVKNIHLKFEVYLGRVDIRPRKNRDGSVPYPFDSSILRVPYRRNNGTFELDFDNCRNIVNRRYGLSKRNGLKDLLLEVGEKARSKVERAVDSIRIGERHEPICMTFSLKNPNSRNKRRQAKEYAYRARKPNSGKRSRTRMYTQ